MKTLIYQSYRTHDVATWLTTCMHSVRQWAKLHDYDYQFIDDEIFSYVPEWFERKKDTPIWTLTDLARLVLAKKFLEQGYDRVVWVDADIFVFNADRLRLDSSRDYALCKEIWVKKDAQGNVSMVRKINNAFMIFDQKNVFLTFYLSECERMHKLLPTNNRTGLEFGPEILSMLDATYQFPLIETVGTFSPILMHDIVQKRFQLARLCRQRNASPIYAAHLCGSLEDHKPYGLDMPIIIYEQVIEWLITEGKQVFA